MGWRLDRVGPGGSLEICCNAGRSGVARLDLDIGCGIQAGPNVLEMMRG